jgi:hypothetical protein
MAYLTYRVEITREATRLGLTRSSGDGFVFNAR